MADRVYGKAGRLDDPIWEDDPEEGLAVTTAKRDSHRLVASLGLVSLFAVLWIGLTAIVSAAVLSTFLVPSGSMAPTIQPGERVTALLPADPARQDVVIFHLPPQASTLPGTHVTDAVKRVVALGGDTISCCTHGHVVVNGSMINEPYAARSQQRIARVRIPQGNMYVLGDNRLDSQDSRAWGPIPTNLVVGTVIARGPAAIVLSPVTVGGLVALVLTFGLWVFVIRRLAVWRGKAQS